jgi:hypothetical protein
VSWRGIERLPSAVSDYHEIEMNADIDDLPQHREIREPLVVHGPAHEDEAVEIETAVGGKISDRTAVAVREHIRPLKVLVDGPIGHLLRRQLAGTI